MHIQTNRFKIDNDINNKISNLSLKYNYNSPGYYSYPTVVDFFDLSKADSNTPD